MTTLKDVATLVRSKNAGPFWLTLDIMFGDADSYRRSVEQDIVTRERVAAVFQLPVETVSVFTHDVAQAIKVSFPRPVSSGSPRDSDVFGGQQYAPVLDFAFDGGEK
jgi:Domain of unknown function (DUF4387)